MKTINDVKRDNELLKPFLKENFKVETIGIFGSYSQGEQVARSEVDILVTFLEPNYIDLLDC